ncbi:MAG: hypothetical protein QXS19_06955, partial [Candidatus Methanomethylicia archaeon]
LPENKNQQQQQQQNWLEESKGKQLDIKVENSENKEYRFLDETEHKKMLEGISYEMERDKKGRWFSKIFKKIFNVKGKRSSHNYFNKNFGLEKPTKPNVEIFKNATRKIGYKSVTGVPKKSSKAFGSNIIKNRVRSLRKLFGGNISNSSSKMAGSLYGNRGATYGRAVGRAFGRALGGISRAGGRFAGILGRLGGLRFTSLAGFFASPVGWVVLAIVLLIVVTVGILYAYYTVLKFIKLFKPAVEFSAEKAIDTYKMAEMEAEQQKKIKSALEERYKKLAGRTMSASSKDDLYDFSTLGAGKAAQSDLIVKPQVEKGNKEIQRKSLTPESKQQPATYDVFTKPDVQEYKKQIEEEAKEKYSIPDYNSLSSEYNASFSMLLRSYSHITGVVEDAQNNIVEVEKRETVNSE